MSAEATLPLIEFWHLPSPDALSAYLASTIRDCLPGRPITLVIGISREKDARSFMAELAPLAQQMGLDRVSVARISTGAGPVGPQGPEGSARK